MSSTRIKGKALKLTLDGQDYWADLIACAIDNEEAEDDTVTFEDAAAEGGGARQWFMEIEAIQSTDPTSFWAMVWDNAGTEVPYVYAPHGNETAAAGKPHFSGTLEVGPPPRIGGEAGKDSTYTFETRFDLTAKPVKTEL